MKPTTPGIWIFRQYGTRDWMTAVIANGPQGLLVHRPRFESVLLDQFHQENMEWKKMDTRWGPAKGRGNP
jgi:hypothetical protein